MSETNKNAEGEKLPRIFSNICWAFEWLFFTIIPLCFYMVFLATVGVIERLCGLDSEPKRRLTVEEKQIFWVRVALCLTKFHHMSEEDATKLVRAKIKEFNKAIYYGDPFDTANTLTGVPRINLSIEERKYYVEEILGMKK